MAQGVSRWPFTSEAVPVPGQSYSDLRWTLSLWQVSLPCQYHSTNAPYPFFHLPPTLYNVSVPVLQFSPVTIIPPMLHTHSFTYHPRYIMFLSQYISFPLSVPFHQCSVLISFYMFAFTRRANGRSLGTPKSNAVTEIAERCIDKYCYSGFKGSIRV